MVPDLNIFWVVERPAIRFVLGVKLRLDLLVARVLCDVACEPTRVVPPQGTLCLVVAFSKVMAAA